MRCSMRAPRLAAEWTPLGHLRLQGNAYGTASGRCPTRALAPLRQKVHVWCRGQLVEEVYVVSMQVFVVW